LDASPWQPYWKSRRWAKKSGCVMGWPGMRPNQPRGGSPTRRLFRALHPYFTPKRLAPILGIVLYCRQMLT
ncbi:MAG: hypothetical protein P5692_16325, partial [Limnospira sp. PMC 1280.21]|nr:hypothetical protein [Limnospira sp. PMC 1280.21]